MGLDSYRSHKSLDSVNEKKKLESKEIDLLAEAERIQKLLDELEPLDDIEFEDVANEVKEINEKNHHKPLTDAQRNHLYGIDQEWVRKNEAREFNLYANDKEDKHDEILNERENKKDDPLSDEAIRSFFKKDAKKKHPEYSDFIDTLDSNEKILAVDSMYFTSYIFGNQINPYDQLIEEEAKRRIAEQSKKSEDLLKSLNDAIKEEDNVNKVMDEVEVPDITFEDVKAEDIEKNTEIQNQLDNQKEDIVDKIMNEVEVPEISFEEYDKKREEEREQKRIYNLIYKKENERLKQNRSVYTAWDLGSKVIPPEYQGLTYEQVEELVNKKEQEAELNKVKNTIDNEELKTLTNEQLISKKAELISKIVNSFNEYESKYIPSNVEEKLNGMTMSKLIELSNSKASSLESLIPPAQKIKLLGEALLSISNYDQLSNAEKQKYNTVISNWSIEELIEQCNKNKEDIITEEVLNNEKEILDKIDIIAKEANQIISTPTIDYSAVINEVKANIEKKYNFVQSEISQLYNNATVQAKGAELKADLDKIMSNNAVDLDDLKQKEKQLDELISRLSKLETIADEIKTTDNFNINQQGNQIQELMKYQNNLTNRYGPYWYGKMNQQEREEYIRQYMSAYKVSRAEVERGIDESISKSYETITSQQSEYKGDSYEMNKFNGRKAVEYLKEVHSKMSAATPEQIEEFNYLYNALKELDQRQAHNQQEEDQKFKEILDVMDRINLLNQQLGTMKR